MRRAQFCMLLAGLLVGTACGRKKARVSRRLPPPPQPAFEASPEVGIASWYGHPYHGRPTASGEIYDMEQMTAAHRTLPFQTIVHVENLDNGMSIDVRITDRGPFVGGRIIDLSKAAARSINMLGPGVAQVRLTFVSIAAPMKTAARPEAQAFGVQVAAFASKENAERMQARLGNAYGETKIVTRAGSAAPWRVLVGRAPSVDSAEALAKTLRAEQNVPEAFVVRLDFAPE